MRKREIFFLCSLGLVLLALDFFTKSYAYSYLKLSDVNVFSHILGGLDFHFALAFNKGMAWGLFPNFQTPILILRMVVIVGLMVYLFLRRHPNYLNIPLLLVAVGGIGNIIDYFYYGFVVDFLSFNLWGYPFPVFNLADAYITIGIVLLFLLPTLYVKSKYSSR